MNPAQSGLIVFALSSNKELSEKIARLVNCVFDFSSGTQLYCIVGCLLFLDFVFTSLSLGSLV